MLYLPPWTVAALAALAFALGACVGSFANCASLRRGTAESVLHGRSHCPHCKRVLGAAELVPLLSWAAQKGACRHCGERLSVRYPATELALGIAFLAVVLADGLSVAGISLSTLEALVLFSLLLYVSLVDFDTRTIPLSCIAAMLAVHLLCIAASGALLGGFNWRAALFGSLVGAFALAIPLAAVVFVADKAFGRESMGGGDLLLFFVAGFYFGWQQGMFLVIIACIVGIIGALATQRRHTHEQFRTREIPFGPAIAIACVVVRIAGPWLVGLYAGLF